jgi:hypothetical protein
MIILIGSRALYLRNKLLLNRVCGDFDFLCTQEEYEAWLEKNKSKLDPSKIYYLEDYNKWIIESNLPNSNCEFEIIKPDSSGALLRELVEKDPNSLKTENFGLVPCLDLLFTLKDSHKYKKFSTTQGVSTFWKNCLDWHRLKSIGCQVQPQFKEFLKLREEETYNYKHPKLNVSKENFFKDDGLTYVYEHDDLHESVKIGDRPAYTYYLKDGEPVLTSKKKFFECTESVRLAGCVEEGLTLALERSLIPHPNTWTPEFAFKFAIAKVCTSITSGYFRQWCFENIIKVIKMFNETSRNYFEKFEKDLNSGKIRKFNE